MKPYRPVKIDGTRRSGELLAAVTIDIEHDYGDRTGDFNILRHESALSRLAGEFAAAGVPVSAFITTELLDKYPQSIGIIKKLAGDYHCHSHTHRTKNPDNASEIKLSANSFIKHFGYRPLGYRAPQGVINRRGVQALKESGFRFSSSVFPSYRPCKYNNLTAPLAPYYYENGLMEIPFAAVPQLRYVISLSYLKIIGMGAAKLLFKIFGLPEILVFDSHLHDYITDDESFAKLPRYIRFFYGIRKNCGMAIAREFMEYLKEKKYKLVTMSQLYEKLSDGISA